MYNLRHDEEDCQRRALAGSLSPMLKMMSKWGLYFGCYGKTWARCQPQNARMQETEGYEGNEGGKRGSVYPTIVLSIVWANVLRFCLAIEVGDAFDSTTIRAVAFGLMQLQCAVMHTSYFIASRNGKLDQMLGKLSITENFADLLHKQSIACVVFNSFIAIAFIASAVYGLFLTNGEFNFAISPFTTLIPVDGIWLNVLRVLSFVLYSFVVQSWVWPFLMNLMLAAVLIKLFRQLNRHFRKALNNGGQFDGSIQTFRSRHQALSEVVHTLDSFVKIGNVASVVCQMVGVIILLFQLTVIRSANSFLDFNFLMLFLMNAVGLTVCIISGLLVNDAVS